MRFSWKRLVAIVSAVGGGLLADQLTPVDGDVVSNVVIAVLSVIGLFTRKVGD